MLKQVERESDENGTPFSILLIDVDHFKKYNDKYGHLSGDELLKFFSSSLRLMLTGEGGSIFRIGGDEFIVVFPNKNSKETYSLAVRIARSIRARPCILDKHLLRLSFSGGIVTYPNDGKDLNDILEGADKAMYASKKYCRGGIGRLDRLWLLTARNILAIPVFAILIIIGFYIYADVPGVKDFYRSYYLTLFHSNKPALSVVKATAPNVAKPPEQNVAEIPKLKPEVSPAPESVMLPPHPEVGPPEPPLPGPKKSDMLFLRTGAIIIGDVVYEDDNEVSLSLNAKSGQILSKFKKTNIQKIERNTAGKAK